MWPYWLMYIIPAIPALIAMPRDRKLQWMPWIFLGLVFVIFIGYRFEVGGDWGGYLRHFERERWLPYTHEITGDIGYVLLNRLVGHLGGGIYGVNLICGLIFTSGLIVFCRALGRPWLAFAIAVPYLIIVVAMGYTRQGVALGLIFWALKYLEEGKFSHYVAFIVIAVFFHRTAILMIPLGIFLSKQGWIFRILAVAMIGFGIWDAFVSEEAERLWHNYVEQSMESQGAQIRVAMNFVAAFFLFLNWKQWKETYPNALLWLWMAFAAVACVVLVNYATTAVDRVALYLTPLQVIVFARLPFLSRKKISPDSMVQLLLLGYGAVLFVWLNYAFHSHYWIPYQNYLFM